MGSMSDLSQKELRALERAARRAGVRPVTILKRALAEYLEDRVDHEAGITALRAARGKPDYDSARYGVAGSGVVLRAALVRNLSANGLVFLRRGFPYVQCQLGQAVEPAQWVGVALP